MKAIRLFSDVGEVSDIRAKDDLHNNADGDEEQSQIDEFSNPSLNDIDTVHNVHVSSMRSDAARGHPWCGAGQLNRGS